MLLDRPPGLQPAMRCTGTPPHCRWPACSCSLAMHAADAAGVVAKKQPVLKPCRLCPAEAKTRSYYGHWDQETTTWKFYCCTGCYRKLKEEGKDTSDLITSNEAVERKKGAAAPPMFQPNTCRCHSHQQNQLQGAPAMPGDVVRTT
jgi:hypothetical protein